MLSWELSSKHTPTNGVEDNHRMSFTVFLGNLPAWVTADDIKGWLTAENLVADAIKVIRNPETQESKGFAFIDAPNVEEMNSIIRRFDRAPLEDRLLRANPAQPPKPKGQTGPPAARKDRVRWATGLRAAHGNRRAPMAACAGRVSMKDRRALSPKNSPRLSRASRRGADDRKRPPPVACGVAFFAPQYQ
jgi:RNA recognition motif-containing protein